MTPRVELRTRANPSLARSYREQSFDDDESDENFTVSDAVEEDDDNPPASPEPTPRRKATDGRPSTRNRGKAKVSYREDSGDQVANNTSRSLKRKRTSNAAANATRPSRAPKPRKKQKVRGVGAPFRRSKNGFALCPKYHLSPDSILGNSKTKSKGVARTAFIPTDGKIPHWTSLPYALLEQIFSYAINSREGETRPTPASTSWLLGVARLNKKFLEPALAALYYSPPLSSGHQAFQLYSLLSSDTSKHTINYNTKVKRFDIEMESCLVHSTPGYGVFDLASMIPFVPQLQKINVWSRYDFPEYRSHHGRKSCYLGNDIFQVMEKNNISLTSWHWKGVPRDAKVAKLVAENMNFYHPKLEKVGFTDFDAGYFAQSIEDYPNIGTFCSTLPKLRDLTFQKCMVNPFSLNELPANLTRLTFIDCDLLESTMLQTFLESHGSALVKLVLHNNRNLNLSFLVDLKTACPQLQVLSIDLNYYSTLLSADDAEPGYYYLLFPDEVPTWPTSLQMLEINHLRKWPASAAGNFFESIAESAALLPDLRKIILSASVNELEWKPRAAFRDEWESKLERIFLRRSEPPNPHLMSLKAFRLWKQGKLPKVVVESKEQTAEISDDSDVVLTSRGRPSNRQNRKQLPTPQPSEGASASRRLRSQRKASEPLEESDAPQPLSSLRDRVMNVLENHIQGMCDVVDVRIGNLRPRENQYDETNFLDSEKSGDEDYVEGQDEFEDGQGYAW